jgi:hypothetical protein
MGSTYNINLSPNTEYKTEEYLGTDDVGYSA